MTPERVQIISDRYIELYENITGKKFDKEPYDDVVDRIEGNVRNMLSRLVI
jgi:phosphoribosylaminoimidazole-succinocarboxamide synthase